MVELLAPEEARKSLTLDGFDVWFHAWGDAVVKPVSLGDSRLESVVEILRKRLARIGQHEPIRDRSAGRNGCREDRGRLGAGGCRVDGPFFAVDDVPVESVFDIR